MILVAHMIELEDVEVACLTSPSTATARPAQAALCGARPTSTCGAPTPQTAISAAASAALGGLSKTSLQNTSPGRVNTIGRLDLKDDLQ